MLIEDIETIFDRWETKVSGYEYEGGCFMGDDTDALETEFLEGEEREDLEASLEELLAETAK